MSSNLNQREAALRAAMANATLAEKRQIVAELDRINAQRLAKRQSANELNMARTAVRNTLSPVLVHGMHTADTDWIGEQVKTAYSKNEMSNIQREAQVEASKWFRSVSAAVRAYPDEFSEQARGFAHRTASQYGTAAPSVKSAILSHIASLYRTAEGTDAAGIESAADGETNPEATPWSEEMSLPGDDAPANEAPEGIEADVYEAEWDDAAPESFIEGGDEYSSIEEPPSVTATLWSRAASQYLAAEEGTTPAQSPAEVDEEQSGEAGSTLPREVSVTDATDSFPNFMERKPAADADSSRAKNISANARRKTANVVGVMSDLGGFMDEVVCRDCFDADPNAEGNIEDSDMAIQDDDEEFFGVACERCNKELPIKSPFTARRRRANRKTAVSEYFVQVLDESPHGFYAIYYGPFQSGETQIMPLADQEGLNSLDDVEQSFMRRYLGLERVGEWENVQVQGSPRLQCSVRETDEGYTGEKYSKRKTASRKTAEVLYESPLVTVERTANGAYGMEQFTVKPADGRAKTFKGETAWSDADRYASDIDFQAWGCTSRINTTPRGSLTASRKTAGDSWVFGCPECGQFTENLSRNKAKSLLDDHSIQFPSHNSEIIVSDDWRSDSLRDEVMSYTGSRKTAEWNEVSCPGCVANGTIAGEILVYENGQWVSKDCPDCVGTGNPAGVIYKNSKRKVAFEDEEFFGDDEPLALMDNPYYDFCPMCYDEGLDRQTGMCVECGYTDYNTLEASKKRRQRRAAKRRRIAAHDEATETPAEEAAESSEEQMTEEQETPSVEARRRRAAKRKAGGSK